METLDIILSELQQQNIPVTRSEKLNERSYGDLEGLNRKEAAERYGKEQVQMWRRSYAVRPPGGESMEDVEKRIMPFFLQNVLSRVLTGENVLLVAHNICLRPILSFLEKRDKEDVANMEISLCTPYIYTFTGEKLMSREIREVPGIVTLGGSLTREKIER